MIDWTTIKSTAQSIIGDLSGAKVVWQDEPGGSSWAKDPVVLLRISALSDIGVAQELRNDGALAQPLGQPLGGDATVTVSAQKQFTLGLRCESFNQDIASGKHAGAVIDSLKTRLKRTSTIERLRGIFCIQKTLGTAWFNYVSQGRQVSCYTLDLLCGTVDNDVDTVSGAGGYIDEVLVDSQYVKDANGTPTLSQVHLDITGGA